MERRHLIPDTLHGALAEAASLINHDGPFRNWAVVDDAVAQSGTLCGSPQIWPSNSEYSLCANSKSCWATARRTPREFA